jgi:signal transduction histidine kinase
MEARGQRVERRLAGEPRIGGPLYVLADRRYARQVLANLVANAAKYGPAGEVIQVQAEQVDGQVRVTVEDRGPGIPSDQQAGLFDRFYRVRRPGDEPGFGLGLAIAKGITDAHGGSMGIESEAGVGTRVWFTLPAAERPPGEGPGE